jgi:hypothetical protein
MQKPKNQTASRRIEKNAGFPARDRDRDRRQSLFMSFFHISMRAPLKYRGKRGTLSSDIYQQQIRAAFPARQKKTGFRS